MHSHGKVKRTISEEEKKKNKETADKVNEKLIEFFKMRPQSFKMPKAFEYTSVIMQLCPDVTTVFNLRREILEHQLSLLTQKEQYELLLKDLKEVTMVIKKQPKSYATWYHR